LLDRLEIDKLDKNQVQFHVYNAQTCMNIQKTIALSKLAKHYFNCTVFVFIFSQLCSK